MSKRLVSQENSLKVKKIMEEIKKKEKQKQEIIKKNDFETDLTPQENWITHK